MKVYQKTFGLALFASLSVLVGCATDHVHVVTLPTHATVYEMHKQASGNPQSVEVVIKPEVSGETINSVLERTLQKTGFSMDPKVLAGELQDYQKRLSVKDTNRLFWTDWVLLDEDTLRSLDLNREKLRLNSNTNVIYSFQIIGCWDYHIHKPNAPKSSKALEPTPTESAFRILPPRDQDTLHSPNNLLGNDLVSRTQRASIKFRVCMLLRKRGLASAYIPDTSPYNSAALIDRLFKPMQQIIEDPMQRFYILPDGGAPGSAKSSAIQL